jgi:hypothetical protein
MIHCWTIHSSQRNQQKLSLSEFNSTQHERKIAKAYANDQIGITTKLHLNTEKLEQILRILEQTAQLPKILYQKISSNCWVLSPWLNSQADSMPQTRTKQLLQISISMQTLLKHCSSRLLLAIIDNCT